MRWFHSTHHAAAVVAITLLFLSAAIAYAIAVLWLDAVCRPKMADEPVVLRTAKRRQDTITVMTVDSDSAPLCNMTCHCRNFNTTDPLNCPNSTAISGNNPSGVIDVTEPVYTEPTEAVYTEPTEATSTPPTTTDPVYEEPTSPEEQDDENGTVTEGLRVKMTTSVEPLQKQVEEPVLGELRPPRATQVELKLLQALAGDRDLDDQYKILVCSCAHNRERSCFRIYTSEVNILAIKIADDVQLLTDNLSEAEAP